MSTMLGTTDELVGRLLKALQRAEELLAQRGPTGQRLYDAPVEEWIYEVLALREECEWYFGRPEDPEE